MAATLILDTLDGAILDIAAQQSRCVRTGVIKNIDTTTTPSEVLWAALNVAGMPAFGAGYPNHGNLLLQRIQVVPLSSNIVRVLLTYETAIFGTPTAYLLRD